MMTPAAFFRLALPLCLLTTCAEVKAQSMQIKTPSGMSLTLTVKRGDTAYSLAKQNGLSLKVLLSYNNLPSSDLTEGQVLRLFPASYAAQRGDTVYNIARKFKLDPKTIIEANRLSDPSKLEVGQVLVLDPSAAAQVNIAAQVEGAAAQATQVTAATYETPAPAPSPVVSQPPRQTAAPINAAQGSWYANAMALVGTPYVYGAASRNATDCSGFVLQVMSPLGIKLPRQSAAQARAGIAVAKEDLRPGDLLFFATTSRRNVISHVGIYLGDNKFINANSYQKKVVVETLWDDDYWESKYVSARRVLLDAMASN